ncbi:MAG: glycosyltransferase family 4 protein [Thermotogaceae bacterium]|nr:glycosyltransferase family 4 protein [Thermotogaceae bacterium]
MRKYVLFLNTISEIGGAELYVLRKARFLENNGFKVYIVTGKAQNIRFTEFYDYEFLEIKEIVISPNLFCKNEISGILERILVFIHYQEQDEIFVESHQIYPAMWAEIFAQKVNRVNLVYCITPFRVNGYIIREFYHKKLRNDELLGCNESYIPETFGNGFKNNYLNIPFDPNEIEKVSNQDTVLGKDNVSDVALESRDISILTISRIQKTYIAQSIIDLSDFCKKYPDASVKYNLVLSENNGSEYDKLKILIDKVKPNNLDIELNGPVLKLTDTIFKGYDLFIGMGTAVLNAVSMGLPSLVVDYRNNRYYGFFGYDYYESGAGIRPAEKGLDYFIKQVLNKEVDLEEVRKKAMDYFLENYESEKVNRRFLEYQYNINKKTDKKYFKFEKRFNYKDMIEFLLLHTCGVRNTQRILSRLRAIKGFVSSDEHSFR